jgi:predicted MFS family arabinose efflux permease
MKFISLASISMATLMCWDAFIPIMPALSKSYCIAPKSMTYGITIFAFSYIISSQYTSYLIDKYSPVKIVKYGLLAASIINLMFIFVNNFYLFLFLRSCLGVSLSVTIAVNSIVNKLYSETDAVKVFSYLNSSIGLGLVAAPLIAIQISNYFNYDYVFMFQSIYCFFCFYCFKYLLKSLATFEVNSNFNSKVVFNLLRNKDLIFISAIRTFSYLPHFIFVSFSSIFILTILRSNADTYSLIMSALGFSCILGGYITKLLNERFNISTVSIAGLIILNCGTLVFWTSRNIDLGSMFLLVTLSFYLFLISIGRSLISPLCSMLLIKKCSDSISSASSLSMIYTYSFCSLVIFSISEISKSEILKIEIINSSCFFGIASAIATIIYLYHLKKSAIKN